MDISLRDLHYFLETAQRTSFSQAALRLGVSQPALSFALKRLESALEVQLFLRSKSGVQLTRDGERALFLAKESFEKLNQFKKKLLEQKDEVRAILKIGIHASVACYYLAPRLIPLLEKNKGLEFVFSHGLSRHMLDEVIQYRYDFGIIVNPFPHPDLVLKHLFDDEVCFWFKSGGLQDTVIYDPDMIQAQSLLKKWPEGIMRSLKSSHLEFIAELCAAGAGIAVLPTRVAKMKNLKRWSKISSTYKDRVFLAYRKDLQNSKAAAVFKESLLRTSNS